MLREIEGLKEIPGWTGVVSDIGGATANMWHMVCTDETWHKACRRASCVYPSVCEKFGTDHGPLIQLMKKTRAMPGVKKAFVASGVPWRPRSASRMRQTSVVLSSPLRVQALARCLRRPRVSWRRPFTTRG